MPTVNGTLQLPGAVDPTDATVTISLYASRVKDAPGYYTAGNETIIGYYQPTVSATGTWSATLTANALITPADTVYKIVTQAPGWGPVIEYISVTNGAGPYRVEDLLTSAPGALGDAYATAAVVASTNRSLTMGRVSEWWLFGHSYAWLYGTPSQRGVQRIAEQVGATFRNYGVSGSYFLQGGATQGGFATLFHSLADPAFTYSGATGFPPALGVVSLQTFYNDLSSYAADETALRTAVKHVLRAALSWCHTSSFFQHDESSTGQSFSSTGWTTTTTSDLTPGTSYTTNATSGRTITVATPANAAGQVVSLWFVADAVDGAVNASSVTFTEDGTAITPIGYDSGFSTVDQWPSVVTTAGVMVARFTIPDDAASHTYVATAGTGGVSYAGYSIEAARPVLVHDVARTTSGAITDALTALINTDIDTVVAESHTNQTKVVEMDTALGKASNVFGDTVHPNVRGHRLIADAVWDALVSVTLDDDEAVMI